MRGLQVALGTVPNSFSRPQLLEDLRQDLNIGPTSIDRRHNLVIRGTLDVPRSGGKRLSVIARGLSGAPFTLTDSISDPDRNGFFQEPLAAGSYTGTGRDAIAVANEGIRSGARGPDFFQLDLRAGYRFRLAETVTLETFGEVFNKTDRSNFNNPIGDRRSPNFLVVTSLRGNGPNRTAQFGVRLMLVKSRAV